MVGSLAAWIFTMGIVIVPAGNVGVVRSLGQVQNQVLYPGPSWVIPFVQDVEEIDTRIQPHTFQKLTAGSKENLTITVTGTMNYHLDGAYASYLVQNVGIDFASKIIDPAFSDYIKQVIPNYSADSSSDVFILNKRDEIRQQTKEQLGENLARYHVIVDDIYLVDAAYPQAYDDAITAKQVEQQNVQKQVQITLQVQEQAKQAAAAAEGQANATRALAAGQRDANNDINASLTQNLIQWQYIQKLADNIQVMLLPSDQGLLFNLQVPGMSASPSPAPSPIPTPTPVPTPEPSPTTTP